MRIKRMTPIVLAGQGGGVPEINIACPAITPTLGAEILSNGGFETFVGTIDDGIADTFTGWTITESTGKSEAVSDVHGGSAALKQTNGGNNRPIAVAAVTVSAGTWYQMSAWGKTDGTATQVLSLSNGVDTSTFSPASSPAAYAQFFATCRATAASINVNIANANNVGSSVAWWDDASAKPITFSSMRPLIGSRTTKNGNYQCTPTIPNAGSQCGILLEYLDDNNFVLMILDRASGVATNARLVSRIAGTYAVARTDAVTYSAGAILKAVVNGTTHQLFYNGAQVGADVVIDNSGMGLAVYGFSTLAGNEVGTVTTSPL